MDRRDGKGQKRRQRGVENQEHRIDFERLEGGGSDDLGSARQLVDGDGREDRRRQHEIDQHRAHRPHRDAQGDRQHDAGEDLDAAEAGYLGSIDHTGVDGQDARQDDIGDEGAAGDRHGNHPGLEGADVDAELG